MSTQTRNLELTLKIFTIAIFPTNIRQTFNIGLECSGIRQERSYTGQYFSSGLHTCSGLI